MAVEEQFQWLLEHMAVWAVVEGLEFDICDSLMALL